jgi:hypothetical protein
MTEPDPIAEAFANFKKRPKDNIVPKTPAAEDATPIPTGPAQPYHVDEFDDDGITHETGTAFTGKSIYSVEQLMEQKRQREERERDDD